MTATLASIAAGTVKTLLMNFLSEKLLIQVVLILLKHLSASTHYKLDDKIVELYEKQLADEI